MHYALVPLTLVLVTLFCRTNSVQAAEAEMSGDKRDPVLIYRDAGVNNEQESKIRQLAQEYEKAGRVRVERLHNLSKQMTDLSFEPELDEKKILALQDEINELQNSINTERIKLMLKIRALLLPEQKGKLVELMKEKEANSAPSHSPSASMH